MSYDDPPSTALAPKPLRCAWKWGLPAGKVCLIKSLNGEEKWPMSWASHLPLTPPLQRWEFQRILISN